MRRYLILDLMEKKKMSRRDVSDASKGLLTYDMVEKQLKGSYGSLKDKHIKGYINALKLSDEEVVSIFFE